MNKFEVIFFDLDHTILDTNKQYEVGVAMATDDMFDGTAPENFDGVFIKHHRALWSLYDKRVITMEQLRRAQYVLTCNDFEIESSIEDADKFQDLFDQTLEDSVSMYDGTVQLLKEVAKGHKLGIITNGAADLQWRKVNIAGIQNFFSENHVIISGKIGRAKPHPSVYQAACEALNVDPKNALMIGDNYKADYKGALDFGFGGAIWYSPDPDMAAKDIVKNANGQLPLYYPEDVIEEIKRLEDLR